MTNEDYTQFLQYIYDEYVRDRVGHLGRFTSSRIQDHEWAPRWRRLIAAGAALYFMRHHSDPEHVDSMFKLEFIRRVWEDVEDGTRWNNELLDEAGLMDAFDQHLHQIVGGLAKDYLPEIDFDVMRDLGSRDAISDVSGLIYGVKVRVVEMRRDVREILERAPEEIMESRRLLWHPEAGIIAGLKSEKNREKEKRKTLGKIIKALGQIAQGTALSLANVGIATGIINVPVSVEARTIGAVASTATGVGALMAGIGDLIDAKENAAADQ